MLVLECRIPNIYSLKEKRHILKKAIARIQNKLHLAVAEIDYLDKWQHTIIEIAAVANGKKQIENQLQKALQLVEVDHELEVISFSIEYC
ncbi:DUF503 domain-containing protein [Tepidibacillus sp. LV47]|uniref:DUF503 domain-containing protein n=1 Tax=Tepidibacillus sp. LV47 TaxID=3398228 RepID=UPI003AAEC8EE